MMTRLAILTLLFLFAYPSLHAADPVPRLIARLGSGDYHQREQARRSLEQMGEKALGPLRATLHHPDAEVRRHARELVAGIEQRLETARILKPTRVRLVYKDTPVAEAVEDFARRGYPIEFIGDPGKVADHRVTLDTGEVPFWEALQLFKEAAGLREYVIPEVPDSQRKPLVCSEFVLRVEEGKGKPLRVAPVLLEDSPSRRWPTFRAGPLRLRALPPRSGKARGEVSLTLQVSTEPAIGWEEVAGLHVYQAVDDQGRRLDVIPTPLPVPDFSRGFIRFSSDVESPTNRGIDRLPVTLGGVAEDAVRLRELRGILAAWICSAVEPVIEVTDPLESAGKTWTGPGGTALRITKVRAEDGEYQFQLELQPSRTPPRRLEAKAIAGGIPGGRTYYSGRAKNSPFTALDAEGKPLVLATGHSESGGGTKRLVSLHFLARKGQGPPARLVFTGRWAACINLPFVLRDVPLK
jgi:hypothetical protein